MELFSAPRQKLGLLDLEFDSDEGLEAMLRLELIEIACSNGVSDPETLRSVLTNLSAATTSPNDPGECREQVQLYANRPSATEIPEDREHFACLVGVRRAVNSVKNYTEQCIHEPCLASPEQSTKETDPLLAGHDRES